METKIDRVMLDGNEILIETAKKYVKDYMTLEAFLGGIAIHTEDGVLQAEISLV